MSAAVEHALWCAGRGWTPDAVLRSIGIVWRGRRPARWDDAVLALGRAHRLLSGG